jgi:translocation and assembly module TamA
MTRRRGAAGWWLAASALLAAAGCSTTPSVATQDGEAVAKPSLELVVKAPSPLRELLSTHLDIARLQVLANGEPIGELELDRLIAATPAQARGLLETEGYFEPRIEMQRRDDGALPQVTVVVEPGPQVRVGAVTIDVQGELEERARAGDAAAIETLQVLEAAWPLSDGQPFRNTVWSDAKAAMLARLRSEGYLGAEFSGTGAQVDVETERARLFVVVDSGPLYRIGEIRVQGATRFGDDIVRTLSGFGPGRPATERTLIDYQERLVKSGLFGSAVVTVDPDPANAGATPVTVVVQERQRNEATFGVGYSTNVGARASLEMTNRQLFGWPLIATNSLQVAQLERSWTGELSTYPDSRFWRWLVAGSLENQLSSTDNTESWRVFAGRAQNTQRIDRLVGVALQQATLVTDEPLVPGTSITRSTANALSGLYNFVWRRLDDLLLPTYGETMTLQGSAGWAYSQQADDGPFARAYGRFTVYRPLGGDWYGQARVELGQVFHASSVEVPQTLLFRPGGQESVRGYVYRSLGPKVNGNIVGGDVMFTGSVEIARPILQRLPSLWGAAFVDAGSAAFGWDELRPVVGAGVGLRWRSPVGPLAIDIAYGFETQAWRTSLSVGVVF